MDYKKFAMFAIVFYVVSWAMMYVNGMLEGFVAGFGFIGTAILFIVPLMALYYAMTKFVFKRERP